MSYYYNEAGEKTPLTEDVLALFKRKMSPEEKAIYLDWLHQSLQAFPFYYVLAYGTLLGSLLYEGFIPWDDDFDIFCHWEDYDNIKDWAIHTKQFHWHDIHNEQNTPHTLRISKINTRQPHIHFENPARHDQLPWGWPSLDVCWLTKSENKTRSYLYDKENYCTSSLDPIRYHTFEGRSFPVPNLAENIIVQKYPHGLVHAIPPWYDHQEEKHLASFRHILVPLRNLAPIYPILNKTLPKFEAMGYIDTKSIHLS